MVAHPSNHLYRRCNALECLTCTLGDRDTLCQECAPFYAVVYSSGLCALKSACPIAAGALLYQGVAPDPVAGAWICRDCPFRCTTCSTFSVCTTCILHYYPGPLNPPVASVSIGCLECPVGCDTCTSATDCQACTLPAVHRYRIQQDIQDNRWIQRQPAD